VKTVEVKCDSCTIFNSFCQQCDASVHSLPLKKSHKRNFYSVNTNGIIKTYSDTINNNNIINNNCNINTQKTKEDLFLSSINNSLKRDTNQITTDKDFSKQFITLNQNDLLGGNTNLFKTQDIENMDKTTQQIASPIYVNSSYSREYINELKAINLTKIRLFLKTKRRS